MEKEEARLHSAVPTDRTRAQPEALSHLKSHLNTFFFYTVTVVKHWNRLAREVMKFQPLEIFKTQLDTALSNLLCLCFSRDVGQDNLNRTLTS